MFFRKKIEPKLELTFKERVGLFWRNFSTVSDRLLAAVRERRSEELDAETSSLVFALSPSLAWVYGPGSSSEGRSLTVSSEGCAHRRLLTQYWVDHAPVLAGWDFFPSRQPSEDVSGFRIQIGGEAYTPLQFWITPEVDEENEVVHLVAWSPAFLSLESKDRWQILFLWLDEVLGEDHVSNRLGKIDIRDDALGPSFPLTELKSYIEETEAKQGWKAPGSGQFTGYSFEETSDAFLRADMIAGHTSQRLLWRDYIEGEGKMDDPLAGSGAAYYFLRIPNGSLPDGKQTDERFRLEELLEAELKTSADGLCLGGGGGRKYGYIDFLLFDGPRSVDRVLQILRADGAVKKATLHRFAGDPAKVIASL
ncbi:MAG: Tetratricopeptide repeat protein [Akkermansiaceae bacterium]|nr:Tetratricopeptide repeat protein [Akkermansiaceae bacterium]